MKVAIVGSRTFTNRLFVEKKFFEVLEELGEDLENVHIVSGGARGVDTIAQQIARDYGLSITIHYPNWKKYGNRATAIRNEKIAEEADVVIAFPARTSRGTKMTIEMARRKDKKVYVFEV